MTYLLDTHVIIFALYNSPLLKPEINSLITDPANSILVSAVSFWEISIKSMLGKFRLEGSSLDAIPTLCEQMNFTVIPLTPQEACSCYRLPATPHKDPFDRMLVWQTMQRGIPLISRDHRLSYYQSLGARIVW
jgi:PIN domain nuclease of toxin-antitoxin system